MFKEQTFLAQMGSLTTHMGLCRIGVMHVIMSKYATRADQNPYRVFPKWGLMDTAIRISSGADSPHAHSARCIYSTRQSL